VCCRSHYNQLKLVTTVTTVAVVTVRTFVTLVTRVNMLTRKSVVTLLTMAVIVTRQKWYLQKRYRPFKTKTTMVTLAVTNVAYVGQSVK